MMVTWSEKSKAKRKEDLRQGRLKVNCKIYDLPSKEDLEYLYYDKCMTMVELGKLFDTSNVTVSKWMKRYGIKLKTHSSLLRERYKKKKIDPKNKIDLPSKEDLEYLYHEKDLSTDKISETMGVSPKTVQNWFRELGINFSKKSISKIENEVVGWLSTIYSGEIIQSKKGIVSPRKEIDIYLPEHKMGIEINGIFWHTELKGKHKYYHLEKTEACEKEGIMLYHISDLEWIEKGPIWKSVIENALGMSIRIGARKLFIDTNVPSAEANTFCTENHLQGFVGARYRYGLRDKEGTLMSLMTFGHSRYTKEYDFELIRFCNKKGRSVQGGASRLLKAFRNNHPGCSIVSYANRRWSQGFLYQKIGFSYVGKSDPSYTYVGPDMECHSRVKFQKHKLKSILPFFDESATEWDNMQANGYDRIWDCGNLKFGIKKEYP